MKYKNDASTPKASEIVVWGSKFMTGIELIDGQHKELVNLTNELYNACFAKDDELPVVFKNAMSRMVEYVRFHFDAELKLLNAINYPEYGSHKKMHETLVKNILEAAKEAGEGKKFVPNNFVRTLVDWVFSHIAVYDKQYSAYVAGQVKNGALTTEKIKEIERRVALGKI